ncbi:class II glutamine amidotransferase domain-containing protein [Sediminivirga luteola]|uniref:glutamine--fructose-6-phosphate transaminase (isomerizing) n=1 Tax=Sediminivirga luteola TaxID=1774748 RepID=A0A8J2TW38_9MICO|nr:glutamine amidotransferase [Sediminivirga luteola]GGA05506.1 glutamine amidotransferase [Sediminivirga luteola]
MCGIAGLHLRDSSLEPRLGELLEGMMCTAAGRGADAAGVGIYGDPAVTPPGQSTVCVIGSPLPAREAAGLIGSLLAERSASLPGEPPVPVPAAAPASVRHEVAAQAPARAGLTAGDSGAGPSGGLTGTLVRDEATVHGRDAGQTSIFTAAVEAQELARAVREALPEAVLTSRGTALGVMKGTGEPATLAETFGLAGMSGYQGVAHTRMATESAVTPGGSHPYSVGPDQCMVHNGSFSNHATIRRELQAEGIEFDSENDTEVGARFVARELARGASVEESLMALCRRFDGFYTLLVATADSFAVVRDAIACKPAVIAETDRWVAMASEYRYLTGLPGVESARVFEPEPEVVYTWQR